MNIIVTVKVVPEKIVFNKETKRIERNNVGMILNPTDLIAAEEGRKLKEENPGSRLIAISMGPPNTENTLRELFKYGFDRVLLISDKAFAGSDTLATAFVLARAIQKIKRDFDVVLTGAYSVDGATAQVSGEIAAFLNVPFLSNVISINNNKIKRFTETSVETFSINGKYVLSIADSANFGISENLFSLKDFESKTVELFTNKELVLDTAKCGLAGSKTSVLSLIKNEVSQNVDLIKENAGKKFAEFLSKVGVL
jgi:electron transfer flavoprotein beta subunit